MKKIATILMLVVAILVGGMTVNAKTTKKKNKARTTQNSKSAVDGASKLDYDTFFSDEGGIEIKNILEIESALYKAGFKLKSSSTHYKFTCNGTTVEIYGDGDYVEIGIKFMSKKICESFVSKMKDSGFEYQYSTRSGIHYYRNKNIQMMEEANKVTFICESI